MSKITKVIARQVYDSRGNPTVEAEVFANNMKARAICPSGASRGSHEACLSLVMTTPQFMFQVE